METRIMNTWLVRKTDGTFSGIVLAKNLFELYRQVELWNDPSTFEYLEVYGQAAVLGGSLIGANPDWEKFGTWRTLSELVKVHYQCDFEVWQLGYLYEQGRV